MILAERLRVFSGFWFLLFSLRAALQIDPKFDTFLCFLGVKVGGFSVSASSYCLFVCLFVWGAFHSSGVCVSSKRFIFCVLLQQSGFLSFFRDCVFELTRVSLVAFLLVLLLHCLVRVLSF